MRLFIKIFTLYMIYNIRKLDERNRHIPKCYPSITLISPTSYRVRPEIHDSSRNRILVNPTMEKEDLAAFKSRPLQVLPCYATALTVELMQAECTLRSELPFDLSAHKSYVSNPPAEACLVFCVYLHAMPSILVF